MSEYIFKKYNSIGEFSNTLKRGVTQKPFESEESSNRKERHGDFYGTFDYETADKLLLFGDKDIQRKIEDAGVSKMRNKLKYEALRKQVFSSVVGFAPNVPAYIAGTPNSMINMRQIKTKQRVINVLYNASVSGFVSAENIISATSKMLSAIMIIESSGIRVNMYIGELTYCDETSQKFGWILRIKDSGQKLDTLKMSYPLAHPSMLRRHGFRAMEIAEGIDKAFAEHGYGRPVKDEKDSMKFLKDCKITNINKVLCYTSIANKTAEEIAKMIVEG